MSIFTTKSIMEAYEKVSGMAIEGSRKDEADPNGLPMFTDIDPDDMSPDTFNQDVEKLDQAINMIEQVLQKYENYPAFKEVYELFSNHGFPELLEAYDRIDLRPAEEEDKGSDLGAEEGEDMNLDDVDANDPLV